MKYLDEFRDNKLIKPVIEKIKQAARSELRIMEVCGGQTQGIVKNGLNNILKGHIDFIHGPGCPVCVTPINVIDQAIALAAKENVILCSFGDMIRVPGTNSSLLEAKSEGADVQVVYSPMDALAIAKNNPAKEVVLFAIGFETTVPANAMAIFMARESEVENFSALVSQIRLLPVLEELLSSQDVKVDALLSAGHVCTITGYEPYHDLVERYGIPIIIAGFEPLDILQATLEAVQCINSGEPRAINHYKRSVLERGNLKAQELMERIFESTDSEWRGLNVIADSGLRVREEFAAYDATVKYSLDQPQQSETTQACRAADVLLGKIKPHQCPEFAKTCFPMRPMGAPMVSSEGACAAYYSQYKGEESLV